MILFVKFLDEYDKENIIKINEDESIGESSVKAHLKAFHSAI